VGVGGDEQQRVADMPGRPAADCDGEPDGGGQAGRGPADRGLAKVAAQPLDGGGEGVEVGDAAGDQQLRLPAVVGSPRWAGLLHPGLAPAQRRWQVARVWWVEVVSR